MFNCAAQLVMNVPFTAIYFTTYESAKKLLNQAGDSEEGLLTQLTAGGAAGDECFIPSHVSICAHNMRLVLFQALQDRAQKTAPVESCVCRALAGMIDPGSAHANNESDPPDLACRHGYSVSTFATSAKHCQGCHRRHRGGSHYPSGCGEDEVAAGGRTGGVAPHRRLRGASMGPCAPACGLRIACDVLWTLYVSPVSAAPQRQGIRIPHAWPLWSSGQRWPCRCRS